MDSRVVYIKFNGQAFGKGKSWRAGMIEKDSEPGFYSWSSYHDGYGGICPSISECRESLLDYVKQSIRDGSYFMQIPK